jgi:hypothetical protein|tara:strand:+ start:3281 stop:3700 length:420 start_codon:yes stop_codon:yes gene_type:complete
MKFHNYFPKNIFYCIFLIYILSSCASLNTSNKTYNLEGKFSYISSDFSAIFLINVNTNLKDIKIQLYEPINGGLVMDLQSHSKNNWKIKKDSYLELKSTLPTPYEVMYIIKSRCIKKINCKFSFNTDNDIKINVLLNNV